MNIKIENWKLIVLSVFYFIFAFVSYSVAPQEFLSFFRVAGIIIAIVGGLQILIYFLKKDYLKPQEFSFSLGLLLIFAGLVVAFKAEFIVMNYRPVVAVAVVLDSILRMQYSMNLLRVNDGQWKLHTALAVLPAIFGLVLILADLGTMLENSFSFLLIFDGIANITTVLYYRKFVKRSMQRMKDGGQIVKQANEEEATSVEVEERIDG